MLNLKPCPFCDGDAELKRMGTSRESCIIACTECGCSLETNETTEICGTSWNQRTTGDVKQALFRVGKEINEEQRMTENSKKFAIAIILNEISSTGKDD